jgi:hypothetical protein
VRARASALLLACFGVALVLGAVARSASGPAPSFAAASKYATGRDPGPLAIVDLNGDGEPELDYRTGEFTNGLAIAELNGDGKPDVVTSKLLPKRGLGAAQLAGLCNVQDVKGMRLAAAKARLRRVSCRIGKVGRAHSKVWAALVISQKPKFGAVLRGGGKVNVVISRGRRRKR